MVIFYQIGDEVVHQIKVFFCTGEKRVKFTSYVQFMGKTSFKKSVKSLNTYFLQNKNLCSKIFKIVFCAHIVC